jgi:hypothetical protein
MHAGARNGSKYVSNFVLKIEIIINPDRNHIHRNIFSQFRKMKFFASFANEMNNKIPKGMLFNKMFGK